MSRVQTLTSTAGEWAAWPFAAPVARVITARAGGEDAAPATPELSEADEPAGIVVDPVEQAALERARGGDPQAFETIYRAHVGRVYTLTLRLLGDADRAEEVTQDVFVRIWEKLDRFRGDSAFSTWLHRVTVNASLDRIRTDTRRSSRQLWLEDGDRHPHPGRRDAATAIDLEKAISDLPAGARTIFVLHDVEGYRHGEIAELMGVAEGTSKAQLHRARRLLREVLR